MSAEEHRRQRAAGEQDDVEIDAAKLRGRALARRQRQAMRRRARRIRRAIAALAVAFFVVAFATVYVQLATGHDPALVAAAKRAAVLARERADDVRASGGSKGTGDTKARGENGSSATEASSDAGDGSQADSETTSSSASTSESSGSTSEASSGTSPVTTSQS